MSASFGNAQQTSPTLVGEGDQRQIRLTRDGALVGMDWIQAAVMQGIVHTAGSGTGSTPVATNAAYAAGEPDLYLYVPAGTVVIPLSIMVCMEDTGTIDAGDCLAGYSSNGDGAVTGTALTIYNYKTLASPASSCTATGVVTSNGTTHLGGTDFAEFWRPWASGRVPDHFAAAAAVNQVGDSGPNGAHWSAKNSPAPVVGSAGTDCALSVFASFQAGVGYVQIVWAEYAASLFA